MIEIAIATVLIYLLWCGHKGKKIADKEAEADRAVEPLLGEATNILKEHGLEVSRVANRFYINQSPQVYYAVQIVDLARSLKHK